MRAAHIPPRQGLARPCSYISAAAARKSPSISLLLEAHARRRRIVVIEMTLNSASDATDFVLVSVRNKYGELIASQTTKDVRLSEAFFQHFVNFDQCSVAGFLPRPSLISFKPPRFNQYAFCRLHTHGFNLLEC